MIGFEIIFSWRKGCRQQTQNDNELRGASKFDRKVDVNWHLSHVGLIVEEIILLVHNFSNSSQHILIIISIFIYILKIFIFILGIYSFFIINAFSFWLFVVTFHGYSKGCFATKYYFLYTYEQMKSWEYSICI